MLVLNPVAGTESDWAASVVWGGWAATTVVCVRGTVADGADAVVGCFSIMLKLMPGSSAPIEAR